MSSVERLVPESYAAKAAWRMSACAFFGGSMATTVESSMSSQITNLIKNDSDQEKAAFRLANQVEAQESLLMKLYAAPEFSTKEAEQKFLKENGLAKYGTLEGARQAIQIKYQRAVKALEFFLQLIKNKFDILRAQIQKLDIR